MKSFILGDKKMLDIKTYASNLLQKKSTLKVGDIVKIKKQYLGSLPTGFTRDMFGHCGYTYIITDIINQSIYLSDFEFIPNGDGPYDFIVGGNKGRLLEYRDNAYAWREEWLEYVKKYNCF